MKLKYLLELLYEGTAIKLYDANIDDVSCTCENLILNCASCSSCKKLLEPYVDKMVIYMEISTTEKECLIVFIR